MAGEWKALLAEERAHLVEIESRPGIHDDARVLTRRFDKIPRKHIDDALKYLATSASVINGDAASTTVVDPKAGRETFSGTWHRLSVQSLMSGRTSSGTSGSENYSIVQVLAYGDPEEYAATYGATCDTTGTTTYRWDMTREQLDLFVEDYSSNQVATTKNITVSQNRNGAYDAVASVSVKDTTGYSLTVDYTYPSDASHNVTVIRRWNMLKHDMERLIAGHSIKIPGRSVNIQVNRNADCTYDVVITTTDTIGGLDIDYTVGVNCDHLQSVSLRWDLTEEDAKAFASSYSEKEEAVTKTVSLSRNADNTFNVNAQSTKVDTEGDKLILSYTYPADASHVVTVIRRWNMLKDAMEALIAEHENYVDGRSVNIQVNRKADCTYDVTITLTDTDGGLDIDYTVGVNCDHLQSVSLRWDLSEAEALSFVSSYSEKQVGVTKTVSVSRNSDSTFNVNAQSTTTSGSEVEVAKFGSSEDMSIKYTFKYNLNRDEYDAFLLTYSTREHGRLRQMQTFRNPDCTFNVIMIDRFKDHDSKIDFQATYRPNLDSEATVLNVWNLWDADAVRSYISQNNLDQEVEGVSHTVRVTRNEDGTFDLAAVIDDGRDEVDEITTVVGKSSTELETAVYKFNLTTEQANNFASTYADTEEGINKSVSLQRQPNGLFNAVGREVTSGDVATIDFTFGREVDIEGRIIAKWGLKDQAAVDDFVSTVKTQTEGLTHSVQIFRNSDGTYNMIANIGLITNEFQFTYEFERTFDVTQHVFHAYNIADHAALVSLIGSKAIDVERKTSRQVRESRNSDGTWNLTIITQVSGEEEIELKTRVNFEGCDAERIELTLYNRTEAEPSPTVPSGSQLMEKRASQQSDGSIDWVFVYQKKGIKAFTVRERDPGAEAEMVEILLLNRGDDTEPGVTGFVLVMKVVEERGQCLANYRYTYQKEGTKQHVTETRFPDQDAEQKSYTYLNRKVAPDHSSGGSMLTIAKSVRERGGLLADYLFIDIKTSGNVYTIGRRKLPGGELLLQKIYLNVANGDITGAAYWGTASSGGDGTGYVQAVDINERGRGYADIRQTIVFPFGYDGNTIIACQTGLDIQSKGAGANQRNISYRYWWTLYRSKVITTVRVLAETRGELPAPSFALTYPNNGSTTDGTVAFLLTGTMVSEKYTNTQYGFFYKDTTTTVYSNSNLYAFNGGAPLKTVGKSYAAALV